MSLYGSEKWDNWWMGCEIRRKEQFTLLCPILHNFLNIHYWGKCPLTSVYNRGMGANCLRPPNGVLKKEKKTSHFMSYICYAGSGDSEECPHLEVGNFFFFFFCFAFCNPLLKKKLYMGLLWPLYHAKSLQELWTCLCICIKYQP